MMRAERGACYRAVRVSSSKKQEQEQEEEQEEEQEQKQEQEQSVAILAHLAGVARARASRGLRFVGRFAGWAEPARTVDRGRTFDHLGAKLARGMGNNSSCSSSNNIVVIIRVVVVIIMIIKVIIRLIKVIVIIIITGPLLRRELRRQ